jgi:methylenetetrahydrofolate dehydrogenase (NADP+)/methenyltetrahydrofolate cyclohydrolase
MYTSKIINGKIIAEKILDDIRDEIQLAKYQPVLIIVAVGRYQPSETYNNLVQKTASRVGIMTHYIGLPNESTEDQLIHQLHMLSTDRHVDGILLQLPLPSHFNRFRVTEAISPNKDVDGLTSISTGFLMNRCEKHFIPCTPAGILHILKDYQVELKGSHIVVINNSPVIGRPLSQLLLNRGATVTICNSCTCDLALYTRVADIIITAVGKPNLITSDMVKTGVVVIDAGYGGDVSFEDVITKARLITPLRGGVGPMTIAYLLKNTLLAFKKL